MPAGAIYVGRGTKWGNPYTSDNLLYRIMDGDSVTGLRPATIAECVDLYRRQITCTTERCSDIDCREHAWTDGLDVNELRGHDLACWCPLSAVCHADVLLELAAGGASC